VTETIMLIVVLWFARWDTRRFGAHPFRRLASDAELIEPTSGDRTAS
jgi:hypothetical protein